MSDYTKEQLHKLYRDLVINRSTRPMTTKELRDNTSYINEDWEEAFDNRQLTPEQEDKAIAIRYNYPRDTKTAAFDALNTLFEIFKMLSILKVTELERLKINQMLLE